MSKNRLYRLILLFLFVFQMNSAQEINNREFRGVWIATVKNIDWPSSKNLTTDQQKQELIKLLDMFKNLNFNAVIFQIRPSADAFYYSKFEPWSTWLTGESGQAPVPYYDPLSFAVVETHKRGMEFHAWLNPYRAVVDYENYNSNPLPLANEYPNWFVNYGKNKYFNPGIPEVRAYTNKVVADIVQNYDIDAIHFDDYFYPYKIENINFPDEESFKKYGANYYPNKLEDWRRENVNVIIEELFNTIKSIKPWVQFGISPFGVWRNNSTDPLGSDTAASQTNYDDLYADILLWLKNGWLDYVLPQAYWHIGFEKADYKKIAHWWAQNNHQANLYIGQAMYRLARGGNEAWTKQNKTEIEKQLDYNKTLSNINGTVYFSAKSFFNNPFEINQILKNNYYQTPILPPSVNHNKKNIPQKVFNVKLTKIRKRKYQLTWESIPENKEKEAIKYLIFQFSKNETIDLNKSSNIIALTGEKHFDLLRKRVKKGTTLIVQAVSRNNNTSDPVSIKK